MMMTHRFSASPSEENCFKEIPRHKRGQDKLKGIIMKIKSIIILSFFVGAFFLSVGYEYSRAGQKTDTPGMKIGIISVRKVLRNCKRSARYKVEVLADQGKKSTELEKLSKDMQMQEAGLNALKPGSSDYLAQLESLLKKRYELEAQQDFNKQQNTLKHHRWTEDIYKEILQITRALAKE